ncbi:oxygenase MpaB family protein [Sphingomonas sp. ID1715]|uniref:oxygenase MpaB family protein n=1 Tax=Sphingomonas sp. ID1715 TaxID=1656898 RepID=UPI0020C2CBE3|nr:oxygenase MpaB family protein [Sphingomonas sp. ID1715]
MARPAPPALPPLPFSGMLKRRIASEIVAIFNDPARDERPVVRRPDGLFGPRSVTWRVHGDVTSMMVGGISSLLLQMLHPAVLAGVWDHSNFRGDMHGRLRRTAKFVALTTYGGREDAEAAIARVRAIHGSLGGTLPDGTAYRADDPKLLAWVHATETVSFLAGWRRYAEPRMSLADQDRYFAEMAQLGEALGANPVPCSRVEALALIDTMRPELLADERTREVAQLVLRAPVHRRAAEPLLRLTMQAAVDLLPVWARRMHGLDRPAPLIPLVRAGTLGVARTLRWAFG